MKFAPRNPLRFKAPEPPLLAEQQHSGWLLAFELVFNLLEIIACFF